MEAFDRALVASNINPKIKHPSKDVPTCWNATYLMIESLVPLKLAFQKLKMDANKFEVCPLALDWDELLVLRDFLEPFYKGKLLFILNFTPSTTVTDSRFLATLELSASRHPTTNHIY